MLNRVLTLFGARGFQVDHDEAYWRVKCPSCGSSTVNAIAILEVGRGGMIGWLLCPGCGAPNVAVREYSGATPRGLNPARTHEVPPNLPEAVAGAWTEALDCFSVHAYTASALMCRKIVFYLAVDRGLSAKVDGRAPGFLQCIDYLVTEGVITSTQRDQWVDRIRVLGNSATHDVSAVSEVDARASLDFTLMLLNMVYVYPAMAGNG